MRCNIKKILENRIIAESLFKFELLLIVPLGSIFNFKFLQLFPTSFLVTRYV